jgi:hypothetical protein
MSRVPSPYRWVRSRKCVAESGIDDQAVIGRLVDPDQSAMLVPSKAPNRNDGLQQQPAARRSFRQLSAPLVTHRGERTSLHCVGGTESTTVILMIYSGVVGDQCVVNAPPGQRWPSWRSWWC